MRSHMAIRTTTRSYQDAKPRTPSIHLRDKVAGAKEVVTSSTSGTFRSGRCVKCSVRVARRPMPSLGMSGRQSRGCTRPPTPTAALAWIHSSCPTWISLGRGCAALARALSAATTWSRSALTHCRRLWPHPRRSWSPAEARPSGMCLQGRKSSLGVFRKRHALAAFAGTHDRSLSTRARELTICGDHIFASDPFLPSQRSSRSRSP